MNDNTLYRATAVGANMTGSGRTVVQQTRDDVVDAANAAMRNARIAPGTDMSTVEVDTIERFDINPTLDVEDSDVSPNEIVTKAVTCGFVDERTELDPEEVLG